jgi:hypothetical protein
MTDPHLFGGQFGGESFAAWRALLAGFYGEPLDEQEAEIFRALTRRDPPEEPCGELWLPIGRRGGKSYGASLIAAYEAFFADPRPFLAPGEWATVPIVASDRKQARTVRRYLQGLIDTNPMLAKMVVRQTTEVLELSNRVVIEIHTASIRSLRGYTILALVADEIAFWDCEGANPDAEIIASVRPALGTLGGKLIAISSPHARRGALWSAYRRHFGKAGSRVLVAQAPTLTMNPTFPAAVVEEAMQEDPASARAEYLAEFRADIETFLSPEVVRAAMRGRPVEVPRESGASYRAFVDPAGGGADQFTLAISHRRGDEAVIDMVKGKRGSPASIVASYVDDLKRYGIREVVGDRYAGAWPRDEFARHGINYRTSDKDRSALYIELLASMNSERIELPPDPTLERELCSLERRASRAGRDLIDHPPGGHDDLANAVAGAAWLSLRATRVPSLGIGSY